MVNEVPAVRADIYWTPRFVTVPPLTVKNILELAVTFVVETVTVPAVRVAVPIVAFVPSFT
jgi:actin-related protein